MYDKNTFSRSFCDEKLNSSILKYCESIASDLLLSELISGSLLSENQNV